MHRLITLWTAVLLVLAAGCQSSPEGTVIRGTIEQADNLSAYLDKIVIGKANNVLERTEIDGRGGFEFAFPEGLPAGVYNLRIGARRINLILDGSEQVIDIEGDLDGFGTYELDIAGSPYTQQFADLLRDFRDEAYGLEEFETFADTVSNGLLAAHTTYAFLGADGQFLDWHRQAYDKLAASYPEAEMTAGYKAFIDDLEAQYAQMMAAQRIKIGQPAPDLELPGPDGKTHRLSDLEGKLVLLDFWASWCKPCRQENPNVVKVYNKYKDEGFTIFSVSLDGVNDRSRERLENQDQLERLLDRHRQRWVEAIETDGLSWPYHVSDLKQWNSEAAQTYGVNAIPRTFFIDREGKIAAINLRGAYQIENAIKKHL